MTQELRCYTFTNFMLSSIQQGIQSGHAAMEIVNKYLLVTGWQNGYADVVTDWAANHKTIVCLNGGNADGVREWKGLLDVGMSTGAHTLPYAPFFEDEQSLDGNLTSVAVILPARIFEGASLLRQAKYKDDVHVTWDHMLKELRLGWTVDDGTPLGEQRTETYNEWEREFMNKLNGAQLAR